MIRKRKTNTICIKWDIDKVSDAKIREPNIEPNNTEEIEVYAR